MRLAGYIRVSAVRGREGPSFISPESQRDEITAWANLRGVEIASWHTDLDQTGGKLSRPGLNRVMDEIRRGVVEGVAVAKLSRLSRAGVGDALKLVEEIHDHGGKLAAVDLGIDPTTPFGEFALTLMLALSRMERRRIQDSWLDSRRRAVERGVHIASRTPTGYTAEAGKLIPSGDAEAIRRVFRAAAGGASWSELASLLEGVRTPYGATSWTGRSLSHVVSNRVYLGEARSGEFVNPEAHEPIVDEATWTAAQRAPGVRSPRGRSLLAGILRCAGCRYVMRPDTMKSRSGERVRTYRCRGVRPHGACEARAAVLGSVVEPWIVESFMGWAADLGARGTAVSRELAEAEAELVGAVGERDSYRDSSVLSVIGEDAFLAGLRSRQKPVDEWQAKVERLRERAGVVTLAGAAGIRESWADLELVEQRSLLRHAIDAVFVRQTGRANIPIAERAVILWRGEGPDDLPGPGRKLGVLEPFDW